MSPRTQDATIWLRISPFLDEALDLAPAERAAWLKKLAHTDPEVANLVERLLGRHEELDARGFLSGSPLPDTRLDDVMPMLERALRDRIVIESSEWLESCDSSAMHAAQSAALGAGAVLGRYRLIREIGHGGMSSVWLAERSDGVLKREVALKLPYAGPHYVQLAQRFQRERDILAALTHPNIARLYDAGIGESGQAYLAMEHVEGRILTQYCDAERLRVRDRLSLFLQVLAAVEFAHTRLVLHRDLKPANILVTPHGRVVLLDFGVARMLSPERKVHPGQQPTEMLARMMTPDYASPEQIAGDALSTTSDIYSLGVVLYELLCGFRPFRQETEASRRDLEDAILSRDPPRLSNSVMTEDTAGARHSTPRRLKRILRSDLETIVLKALKKAPSERYVSAGAMAQDIRNYLAGLPVSARPDSIGYRCKRFITRHKLQVSAASVAALAIVGGATLAASEARKAATERDNAVALASRNAAMSDFMRALIAEAGLSKEGVTVKELLERSEKLAMANSRERNEDRAAILGMLAELSFSRLNGSDAPVHLMDRALAVLGNSRDTNLRAWLVCSRAELVAKSDAAQLEEAQRSILHELENPRLEPMTASICALNLARFAESTSDGATAVHYAHAALDYFHRGPRQPLVDEAQLLADLGRAYVVNGENQLADHYYAQAVAKFKEAGRETSASANVVRMNWARVSSAAGVPKRALEMYERALAFYTENDPGAHQPILLYNRARVLDYIGRFEDARAGYEAVIPMVREMNNVNQEVGCLMGLASVSEQTDDWPNARRYLDELSHFMTPARLAADDSAAARLAILEGTFDLHNGRAAAARAKFEQALARKGMNPTKVHASIGRADALLQTGDIAAAVTEARSALSMATSLQGGVPYSVFTGSSWLILGRALEAQGARAEAHKAFVAAVDNLSNTVDASHPQLLRARQALSASSGNG